MAGAAGMAALSRRLEKVPDESVRELVAWLIPRAEQIGGRGRWFGKNVKLSARIKKRGRRQSTNTVIVQGTPAALWSIKSYGRRGGYPVTARNAAALHLSSVAPGAFYRTVTIHRPTSGDGRWDRLVREADAKLPDAVAGLIDRRI